MQNSRVRLGELLVEAKIITREQLDSVLMMQQSDPRRLGTLLTETGLTTEIQVTQILSQQLSVPWVSLYHVDFSRQLLDLVPEQLADKHCLVPIFVRRVRGLGNTLYVAMDDPSDESAIAAVQQYAGIPVRAMIAPPSDIREAIVAYYGAGVGLTPSMAPAAKRAAASREQSAVPGPSTARPRALGHNGVQISSESNGSRSSDSRQLATNPPAAPMAPTEFNRLTSSEGGAPPESDSSPMLDVRELGMPRPRKGAPRRMVTLMLLDGSQVTLPARRPRLRTPTEPPQSDADNLTARDIIQALRAKIHGQDPSEILGEHGRWEALLAALLTVLLKKHLIADWEFIDALKRL